MILSLTVLVLGLQASLVRQMSHRPRFRAQFHQSHHNTPARLSRTKIRRSWWQGQMKTRSPISPKTRSRTV
ncbi:hypothetical protein DFH11DRAFT_1620325 [Phellopilus nigrolimitatus]|nr:hypothetical protein DFH11DRAFT_1620325 [Phellopilus nigrolimitatus]